MNSAKVQTLGNLCDLITEQVDPAAAPGALYLGLEHIQPGRLKRTGGGRASEVRSHKFAFRKGDVLYGKLRPYLDKAVLAESDGVCTTELLVLRPKHGIDPRFIACLLHDSHFIQHAITGVTGAHHPRTSWTHIAQFSLFDFDQTEQKNIATLLWRVHDLLEACESTIASAGQLKRAAMRELFARGLRGEPQKHTEIGSMPKTWRPAAIVEVAINTQYGLSVRGQPNGRYPILRMNCQDDGQVIFRDLQYVDLDAETFRAFKLRSGDLLFNRTNSIEHVGRTAIFKGERDAVFASYLIRLAVDPEQCRPSYLNYYMNMPGTQAEIKKLASRAVGQANINASKLRTFTFPLPPSVEEQDEIVSVLETLDQKINLHRQKRAVLEHLFRGVLHKLMTGEVQASSLDLSDIQRTSEAVAA